MTDKELKRLRRAELLEMLLTQVLSLIHISIFKSRRMKLVEEIKFE